MAINKDGTVSRQLNTLFNVGVIRELTDGQLLERFAGGRGEAAELAFAALLDRHGPMVLRVCRSRLADPDDALDASQATFLVLIEKAPGLWVRDSLGPWLHAVALRAASRVQRTAARRRRLEQSAAQRATNRTADREWERTLHEEIDRLPDRYRVPIVLCDLEGRTCEEAAQRMGRPVGTVKSWRARGRERLRQRLTRAGLAPSVGLTTAAPPRLDEAIPALLGRITAGTVPASVTTTAQGVLKAMILKKLGAAVVAMGTLAAVAAGVGAAVQGAADGPGPSPAPALAPARASHDERWPLTLPEAIRIGLGNAENVRVVPSETDGGALTIAPRDSTTSVHRFKSEAMAIVRAIEQHYWMLSQQHVQLWTAKKTLDAAEEVVERARRRLVGEPRPTPEELEEAQRRLNAFKLDVATRTSDVITTERQLRNVLGLPTSGRPITPVTAPVEVRIETNWDESLAAMMEHQPDVAHAKQIEDSERSGRAALDAVARGFLPDLRASGAFAPGFRAADGKPAVTSSAVVGQASAGLRRFHSEIDDDYTLYQRSKRMRLAALDRLGAQRAYFDEGRITIDRCLDAVAQYATAVAQEGQFKANYNIAIANFEEAKGTLLEHARITLADPAGEGSSASASAADPPSAPKAVEEPPARPGDSAEGRTTSFRATIRIGGVPIEFQGSFTVGPKPR